MTTVTRLVGLVSELAPARHRQMLTAGVMTVAVAVILLGSQSPFRANQWTLYAIYGLLAASLVFVWGRGGIFSFGQAAMFGIGGYGYAIAGINLAPITNETVSALLIGTTTAAIAAAVLGYFMFYGGLSGVYVAIITMATSLVIATLLGSTGDPNYRIGDAAIGGFNGVSGVQPLTIGLPWTQPQPLNGIQTLTFVVTVGAAILLGLGWLHTRPFGRITAAVADNPVRAQLTGYDTRRNRLLVFVIGGAIAGFAGGCFAAWGFFINPAVFGLPQMTLVVIWVLIGGRTSYLGAICGVVMIQELTARLGSGGGSLTPIVIGAVLILVVLLLPSGLLPSVARLMRPQVAPVQNAHGIAPIVALPAVLRKERRPLRIRVASITRKFGGLTALSDIDLTLPDRGIHCVIGPNGAGKSTLFNILCGRDTPTSGRVLFDDRDVSRQPTFARARMGVGIKLQVPCVLPSLSVRENLWVAAYSRGRDAGAATRIADEVMTWIGLQPYAEVAAGTLAHGTQQWLEIASAVASRPSVLFLDEPTAGMTHAETMRTADLIESLASSMLIVVVEHDMSFIRRLAAPTTVLHRGQVLMQGSFDDIQLDDRVQDAYLGREFNDAAR